MGRELKQLKTLKKLRFIHAYGTAVSEEDLDTLKALMPNCRIDITTRGPAFMRPKTLLEAPSAEEEAQPAQ